MVNQNSAQMFIIHRNALLPEIVFRKTGTSHGPEPPQLFLHILSEANEEDGVDERIEVGERFD